MATENSLRGRFFFGAPENENISYFPLRVDGWDGKA